jgi:hypothetical protein
LGVTKKILVYLGGRKQGIFSGKPRKLQKKCRRAALRKIKEKLQKNRKN